MYFCLQVPDPKDVEELRILARQFEDPEPLVLRRGKREVIQPLPPRKKNVIELHERLLCLLKELEPWEGKLHQATRNARIRLRREVEEYEEPPEEKMNAWDTSDDEATDSGNSDVGEPEGSEVKQKSDVSSVVDSQTNSGASTPIKALEDEEIDVSQRGRLRKRRIIPNNVEDQYAIKKSRQTKWTDVTSATTQTDQQQAVIVQSGKTQLVDYADIVRQLSSSNIMKPVLFKTVKGGKTVITSVIPISSNQFAVSGEDTATFRMTSCSMSTGRRPLIQPLESVHVVAEKPSQHPTIRTLLSANPNVTAARSQPNDPEASVMEIQSEGTSQQSETTQVTEASGTTHLHVSCETTTLSESSPTMAAVVSPSSSQTTPHKIDVTSSVTLQKMAIPRLQPSALQITPRKIAPVSVSSSAKSITKIQTKYYAANASTLPINVVQQLINERGAKLSTGAYNQSILLIPMDNNGQTTNLLNIKTEIESSVSIASPANQQTSSITPNESKTQLSPVLQSALRATSPVVTPTKSISNQLILPKPPGMLPPPLNKHVIPSSTRYPSNETVRTLLDKRKSTDEKKPPYKVMKLFLNTTQPITFATAASDLALGSTSVSTQAQMDSSTSLVSSSMSGVSIEHTNPTPPSHKTISINPRLIKIVSPDSELQKAQQCVITSISPAKLNTLLLQTSAAGAKSIPSMIKLPSKAALDSAVKAVVTSVNTSLPTVNIKVPSPTSLPSIVPRRNVTKTIQTMKSPIPVAPKVITQYSGGSASLAVSNSSMSMAQPFHMLPTTSNPASAASTPESNLIDVGKANKMAPHVVISKGQMQLRFFNTDSGGSSTIPLVSSSNNPSMRTLSVLSPSTGQSMKSVSSDTATEADPVDLKKSTKPVIALNANGMPIAALRVATGKSTNSTVQVSPSSLVHNTLATGGQVLHTTSSSHLLNHCQPTNLINSTTPSGTQAGLLSPLINLHHGGLVLPAGVQLASPLGLNLLQSGTALHNQGNQNILQGGANPIVTPQLYGINPLMLNTVISAPTLILGGQAKTQMSAGPVESTQTQTNLQVTMAPPLAQLPGSSIMLSSVDASGQLLGKIAATPSPAQRQLVFQCPPGGQQLSALGSHHVSSLASTTNTVTSSSEGTSLMKLLKSPLVTYVDYRNSSRNKTLCTQATESLDLIKKSQPESKSPRMVIPPPAVVKGPKQTISAIRVGSAQVQMPDSQKASTSQQQKLLLFSIGGQLVTGQGVPVTLSNGVLKVLPNGKVIINNQTLTQEQVKQTLSKINNNVATLATNMIANPNDQQSVTNVHVEGKNINVIKESPVVSGCSTTMMKLEDPNQLKKTVVTKVLFDSMNKPVKVFTEPSIGESQSTLPFNPNSTIVQKEHDIKHVVAVHSGLGQPLAINIQSSSSALKQVTNKMGISHGASNQSAETSSTKRVVARPVNGEGDAANADEADEEEHRLVIDDGRSEKEAALNLLTLANQALIPGSIKVELNEDYYDEKSAD
ncbi:hypothetical protein DPMN_006191 [Dreissena polymorpha]|uniref:Uncharacterized protein n=1 Tax=Dreissena polymorpha TaxID=45954 RepID=A0A9D4RXI5_DREPO|nr:hypothetical protein DPMN_006191 [Dreissena polymorpha]